MEKLCKIGADSEVGYYLLSRRQNTNITNANTGLVLTGSVASKESLPWRRKPVGFLANYHDKRTH